MLDLISFGEVTFCRNRLWRWVVYETTSSKINVIYVIWHVHVQTFLAEKPILLDVRNMLGILKEHESSLPKKCLFTFLWRAILVYWNRKKIWKTHKLPNCYFRGILHGLPIIAHWSLSYQNLLKGFLECGASFFEDVSKWTIVETTNYTPTKPTWQWNITIFDRRYIFKWLVFHCHVSFRRSTY